MTRFGGDYYDEDFPNQGALWWANVERALAGRKGQRVLRDLREAMEALPGKRLISGRIANEDGEVCAVGALVLARRCAAGESRAAVVESLAALVADDEEGSGGDETATAGVSVGLTYILAWRLAYLNDEDFWKETPEERYRGVLGWIDRTLQAERAA